MKLKLTGLSQQLQFAAAQLAPLLEVQLCAPGEGGEVVDCSMSSEGGLSVKREDGRGTIGLASAAQFGRALGLYVQNARRQAQFSIQETPAYESLGVMIDCSRDAVLDGEAFRQAVCRLSLMGYTTIQLYTEDTYPIEGYPYFGYMRGKYSEEELREFDRYASNFGIELVPCVQTLAHLGQAIRWACMRPVTDCNDILLVGEEKTYEFLDAMFASLSRCFTSRKINIGMDEAHMLGLGKYLEKNGYRDRSMIMVEHLGRVVELAKKYGFSPMMWSDMFFRLASGGDYYATEQPISQEVKDKVPPEISLVYWDYYSEKAETYDKMISRHMEFNNKIIFAGGAWRWNGFTPANAFSLHVGRLAAQSCRKYGIKDVLITMWGDDGGECSFFSVLPSLQFWAEDCYHTDGDEQSLKERFTACTGGVWDDFMALDLPSLTPDNPAPGRCSVNPSKYLFYQDVLMGLFDKHVAKGSYAQHYHETAETLFDAAKRNPQWKVLFETQGYLSEVLELKAELGVSLKEAYDAGDKETLRELAQETIPEVLARIEDFYESFRAQWMGENKVFGLEMTEIRIGGLKQRVQSAARRVTEYLEGKLPRLEELEEERLYFDCREDESLPGAIGHNQWRTTVTASAQF